MLTKGEIFLHGYISLGKTALQGQTSFVVDQMMVPFARLLVYSITHDGEVLTDNLNFYVEGLVNDRVSVGDFTLLCTGIILCMYPANERRRYCNAISHWLGAYAEWSPSITFSKSRVAAKWYSILSSELPGPYHKTSNKSRTLLGDKIVDNSDVVGASPVGAAPTTSSFSTEHLASMD